MTHLQDNFARLLGRQPSQAEMINLYRVRDALELDDNDAVWLMFMVLEHYQVQYEEIPKQIVEAAEKALRAFKAAADATARSAAETTKSEVAEAAAQAAREVARNEVSWRKVQSFTNTVMACCITAAMLSGATFYYGYMSGTDRGHVDGYERAKSEIAAASWANSGYGRVAHDFAETQDIRVLADCSGKGWREKNGWCYPHTAKDGNIYGWRVK